MVRDSETESKTIGPKSKWKSETAGAIGVGPGIPYSPENLLHFGEPSISWQAQ